MASTSMKSGPRVVQSTPKVINTMKRVKEEMIRFDIPAGTVGIGQQVEMELFSGSGMSFYTIRIGEGVEMLAVGTKSKAAMSSPGSGVYDSYFDRLQFQDFNGAEWSNFYIAPEAMTGGPTNELPFNRMVNFERLMMSWGYKSFLTTNKDIAPTWKLPEGDKIRPFIRNSAQSVGAVAITDDPAVPCIPTVVIARRYLAGSDIDYKHFDQYDGGIKSTKRYYNDWQRLAQTEGPGTDTQAWYMDIIRNEAYKFFQAGVTSWGSNAAHLIQGKIMIDDPLTEYNKYFLNPIYNNLPFTHTYATVEAAVAGTTHQLEKTHRFAPTIDVIKNRNKDLKLLVRDDGLTQANEIISRFYGIRYVL